MYLGIGTDGHYNNQRNSCFEKKNPQILIEIKKVT